MIVKIMAPAGKNEGQDSAAKVFNTVELTIISGDPVVHAYTAFPPQIERPMWRDKGKDIHVQ